MSTALGASDCEAVRPVGLAQPVAATTSLSFVAGAARMLRPGAVAATERPGRPVYAAFMAAVGLGSWWYHGPQGRGAALAHDGTIAVLVAQAIAVPVARRVRGRRMVTGSRAQRRATTAAALMVAAGASYVAGRTASPMCRPTSLLQPHGMWHVLAAASFTLWGLALWPGEDAP